MSATPDSGEAAASAGGDKQAADKLAADKPDGTRVLPPAAQRALQEAAERRAIREAEAPSRVAATEHGGRAGPDPVRFGDWENGGIASDF